MNALQRNTAFFCGLVAVLMILFPPFAGSAGFVGYRFLFVAPSEADIAIGLLMTQLIIVAGVFFTLVFALRPRSDAADKTGDPVGTTTSVTNSRH